MMQDATAPRRDPTRKNVTLLAVCQALAMSGSSMLATVAGLAGYMIAEDKSLATLPVASQFLATMLTTIPASLFMRRYGRRAGFTVGQLIGLGGAVLAGFSIYQFNFPMFVVGSFMIGMHNAFWQYFRFAAADTASEAFRPRASSYVLAGGVLAAVIGPELAKISVDFFEPVKFAGCYAAFVIVVLISISTALSGISVVQFWGALVCLGLGWNFMFIGGTTLLTETYVPAERALTQALHNFLVFSTVAASAFSSGAIQHTLGWEWINIAMIPPMFLVVIELSWLRFVTRQQIATS